jgi:hypothetical protein
MQNKILKQSSKKRCIRSAFRGTDEVILCDSSDHDRLTKDATQENLQTVWMEEGF